MLPRGEDKIPRTETYSSTTFPPQMSMIRSAIQLGTLHRVANY